MFFDLDIIYRRGDHRSLSPRRALGTVGIADARLHPPDVNLPLLSLRDPGSVHDRPDHGPAAALCFPASHQDPGGCTVDARWVYPGHVLLPGYTKFRPLQHGRRCAVGCIGCMYYPRQLLPGRGESIIWCAPSVPWDPATGSEASEKCRNEYQTVQEVVVYR